MKEKRWVSIASSIKTAIRSGELHSGARIATETEMASQWNVSPMTVHRALTELQREGWVVRRQRAGTVVADYPSRPVTKIALVFTTLSHLPQGAYLSGIEESLAEGFQLLPMGTNHSAREEKKCLEQMAAECSAMICYPTCAPENTPQLKKIAEAMPLIFVDRIPEGIDADVVMTDNLGSMLMGLQHLRSLGHSRIAYFMEDQPYISSVQERYTAFVQFCRQSDVANPEEWVRRFPFEMPWEQYFEAVEASLVQMLAQANPVTAIACQQDVTMTAVLEACVHLGLSVPDDLALLSFNDMPTKMQPLARSVNRLVQRPVEMGNMVARRLQLRLATPTLPVQPTRLMTDFYPATKHVMSREAQEFVTRRNAVPGK